MGKIHIVALNFIVLLSAGYLASTLWAADRRIISNELASSHYNSDPSASEQGAYVKKVKKLAETLKRDASEEVVGYKPLPKRGVTNVPVPPPVASHSAENFLNRKADCLARSDESTRFIYFEAILEKLMNIALPGDCFSSQDCESSNVRGIGMYFRLEDASEKYVSAGIPQETEVPFLSLLRKGKFYGVCVHQYSANGQIYQRALSVDDVMLIREE